MFAITVFTKGSFGLERRNMSATRDTGLKIRFLYTNMHQVYLKGVQEAKAAPDFKPENPIDSLKESLKSLNSLHSRLKAMLVELEDLCRK
jgi:hypothetical protein